ncbi:MAG: channel protein TolC [Hyphomicrobium sp.]|nr:channel protein TolC [Hyphomicrobium sp.]PPC80651.1 MAG: channel protein TolC [Hyphomicrobium sp.]
MLSRDQRRSNASNSAWGWFARLSLVVTCVAAPVVLTTTLSAETLREAMASAYQANPRLDAERARLRATDEEVPRAKSGYRPTIEGTAEIGRSRTESTPQTTGAGSTNPKGYEVSIRQSVFNGFQTTNAVAEAEAGVRVGRENLRFIENQTLLDAVTVYMDVVRDQQIVRIRESNVAVLSRELEAAETRRAAREVTKTDVAQARARRARAVSAADLAKSNLKVSRAQFERVVRHPPSQLSEPPLKNKFLPRSLSEALGVAEQESPNVGSALYREQAARHAVDRVWGELLPQVQLEASYSRSEDASRSIEQSNSAQVTGRVTVPFYQGGEVHARVRQAKHTHISRMQEIEQARSETQANVTAAWSRLMAARAQMRSDEVQVEAGRTALDGVREEEKVGQRTLLDLLDAEQEYLDAQVALASTRRDMVVAGYALLSAMGRLSAEYLSLTSTLYDPEGHYHESRQKWFGLSITHADGRKELVDAADEQNQPDDLAE